MSKQIPNQPEGVEGDPIGHRHEDAVDAGKGRKLGQDIPDEVRGKAGYPSDAPE